MSKFTFAEGCLGISQGEAPYEQEPRVVPFALQTPNEYEAVCLPAASVAVFIETTDKANVGMIALAAGPAVGLFIGMEPDNLRQFGSSIVAMADSLDGGRGKQ